MRPALARAAEAAARRFASMLKAREGKPVPRRDALETA